MGSGVELKGFDELIKKLEEAPAKIEKKILAKALDELAIEVSDLLRSVAPFSAKPHTSEDTKLLPHLRYSIEPINMNARKGVVRRKIVGDYYGQFFQTGTERMDARPFVQPVMEVLGGSILQSFMENLNDLVIKELKDGD